MKKHYQRDASPGELVAIGGPGISVPGVKVEILERLASRYPAPGRPGMPRYYKVSWPNRCQFGRIVMHAPMHALPVFTFYQPDTGGLWFLQYASPIRRYWGMRIENPRDQGACLYRVNIAGGKIGRIAISSPVASVLGDDWRQKSPVAIATMLDLHIGADYWH